MRKKKKCLTIQQIMAGHMWLLLLAATSLQLQKKKKKTECQRIDALVPWTATSNQSILKEINPEYSSEGLMLKLKLQNFGHLIPNNWLMGKDPDTGKVWRQEKGTTEDEMARWHHWLDWHESEQASGVGDGQGSLACCSPLGHKKSDMTERLHWAKEKWCHWSYPKMS